jgi:hypothetical protein
MQDSLFDFAEEQVLGEGEWPAFLESWSLQLRNETKMSPQLKSFFVHRRIYSQAEDTTLSKIFWTIDHRLHFRI